MKVHNLRFAVAGAFVLLGLVLFFRNAIAPEFFDQFRPDSLELGTWLSFVLAGWHAARGYMDLLNWRNNTRPVRKGLQSHREEEQPYEKIAEFDFLKPDEREK